MIKQRNLYQILQQMQATIHFWLRFWKKCFQYNESVHAFMWKRMILINFFAVVLYFLKRSGVKVAENVLYELLMNINYVNYPSTMGSHTNRLSNRTTRSSRSCNIKKISQELWNYLEKILTENWRSSSNALISLRFQINLNKILGAISNTFAHFTIPAWLNLALNFYFPLTTKFILIATKSLKNLNSNC